MLHRAAAAPVSTDITQDRKSCQFAFLLDEKPTIVSVGDGGLSIELFDNQLTKKEKRATVG